MLPEDEKADRLALFRERLSSVSWLMRCFNEHIARKANAEDEVTGRFWEGRFKSQPLLDMHAVLTCMSYVDLNPVRAGAASSLESSDFTSIHERLMAMDRRADANPAQVPQPPLVPFVDEARVDAPKFESAEPLPMTLVGYTELLDAASVAASRTSKTASRAASWMAWACVRMSAALAGGDLLDELAVDTLQLAPCCAPERGRGESVDAAQMPAGGLVQDREGVGAEELAVSIGAAESVVHVLDGVLGERILEGEPGVHTRPEGAIAPQLHAVAQLGQPDEDEAQERSAIPLVVADDVQVVEHVLVEQVALVEQEDGVDALAGELLHVVEMA